MKTLSSISLLNNRGVVFLENGDLVNALSLLQEALQEVQLHLNDPCQSNSCDKDDSMIEAQNNQRNQARPWGPFMDSLHQLIPSRGINIDFVDGMCLPNERMDTTVISAITIYNLALVFHVKGLEGNNTACERLLFKAKSFYFFVEDLIQKSTMTVEAPRRFSVARMLSMSVFNNLGQIEFHFCEYKQARAYMNKVSELFQFIKEPLNPVATRFLAQSRALFLVNATAFKTLRTASAA